MTVRAIILVLVVLFLLLGGEILVARQHVNVLAAPAIGCVMAGLVGLTFMRLVNSKGLPQVFALAAVFWLVVLLGMGSLDALTRHDVAPLQNDTR